MGQHEDLTCSIVFVETQCQSLFFNEVFKLLSLQVYKLF